MFRSRHQQSVYHKGGIKTKEAVCGTVVSRDSTYQPTLSSAAVVVVVVDVRGGSSVKYSHCTLSEYLLTPDREGCFRLFSSRGSLFTFCVSCINSPESAIHSLDVNSSQNQLFWRLDRARLERTASRISNLVTNEVRTLFCLCRCRCGCCCRFWVCSENAGIDIGTHGLLPCSQSRSRSKLISSRNRLVAD